MTGSNLFMKKVLIISGVSLAIMVIACIQLNTNHVPGDPRGNAYAGSAACLNCHSADYHSYFHTAHYMASLAATEHTIQGSFANGTNVFNVNRSQKLVMEKQHGKLFQAYYLNGKLKQRHPFDVVFGGVKGQSYLYWEGDALYQLPLSYFSGQHQWSTSPGYNFNFLNYPTARAIGKRCLECHTSYISDLPGKSQQINGGEAFDKSSLVYSVDCERCHGPAAQHVQFHLANPANKEAHFIKTYGSLNRAQRVDMCAVCHSGKPAVMLRSSFEFIPGDTFAKFKLPEIIHKADTAHLDVHGNQVQLLQSSKCFIGSAMDCATCHNVHQNTRGNNALFTMKCLNCHNTPNHTYCKLSDKLSAAALRTNCISCHMPALPTKFISVQVSNKLPAIQFFVHTHHIAIYPQEVKKVLAFIGKKM
jgi:hypothetical protein